MRELHFSELKEATGGFVLITTAVVVGAISCITAFVYLQNSLINLYLYKTTGKTTALPSTQSVDSAVQTLTNDLTDLSNTVSN